MVQDVFLAWKSLKESMRRHAKKSLIIDEQGDNDYASYEIGTMNVWCEYDSCCCANKNPLRPCTRHFSV